MNCKNDKEKRVFKRDMQIERIKVLCDLDKKKLAI